MFRRRNRKQQQQPDALPHDERTQEEIAALTEGMTPVQIGGLTFWELPKREDKDNGKG